MSASEEAVAFFAQRDEHVHQLQERRKSLLLELEQIDRLLLALTPPVKQYRHGKQSKAILEYLRRYPGATSGDVGRALGGSTASATASMAVNGKLVRRKVEGLWRYYLPLRPVSQQQGKGSP